METYQEALAAAAVQRLFAQSASPSTGPGLISEEPLRNRLGAVAVPDGKRARGVIGNRLGTVREPFGNRSGTVLEPFQRLEPFSNRFLNRFRNRLGTVSEPFCSDPCNRSGVFRNRLGAVG